MNAVLASNNWIERIIDAITMAAGTSRAALHEPVFAASERDYVLDCLDSTYVSSVGAYVERFEETLQQVCGVKHAVAVVNGTAALHVALLLAGVQAEDEVLMPSLTFVASANAVSYCKAIPHFVDCEEQTLGIDCSRLRTYLEQNTRQHAGQCLNISSGRIVRALMPTHVFGHPGDLDGMTQLAGDFNLVLVEDAAESLGSFYKHRHTGGFGRLSALSFNGNKIVTTGGGGAILTNDPALARAAKHLTTTAKLPHRWGFTHDKIGFNYRMPNLNAALGCGQLEHLDSFLEQKRSLHRRYIDAFADFEGIRVMVEPQECSSNYWLQALILDPEYADQLEPLLERSNAQNLMTRPIWDPMHTLLPYAHAPRMSLPVTESLALRIINVPSSASLVEGAPNE